MKNRKQLDEKKLAVEIQLIFDQANDKIEEIESFIGFHMRRGDFFDDVNNFNFQSLKNVWNYASTDKILGRFDANEEYLYIDDEVRTVCKFFHHSVFKGYGYLDIPDEFWNTNIGFSCQVAIARFTLDRFFPLTPAEISLLADCSVDTIEQECESQKINSIKGADNKTRISAVDALMYLKSVKAEPFYSTYDISEYKDITDPTYLRMVKISNLYY